MLRLGWALMSLGGCVLLVVALMDFLSVFSLFFALGIFIFGSGFIYPNLFARVMEPYGHQAGIAGSTYGFVQMLGAGIASSIMAITPEITVILMLFCYCWGGLAPRHVPLWLCQNTLMSYVVDFWSSVSEGLSRLLMPQWVFFVAVVQRRQHQSHRIDLPVIYVVLLGFCTISYWL